MNCLRCPRKINYHNQSGICYRCIRGDNAVPEPCSECGRKRYRSPFNPEETRCSQCRKRKTRSLKSTAFRIPSEKHGGKGDGPINPRVAVEIARRIALYRERIEQGKHIEYEAINWEGVA